LEIDALRNTTAEALGAWQALNETLARLRDQGRNLDRPTRELARAGLRKRAAGGEGRRYSLAS
jgi:hypothetical protein